MSTNQREQPTPPPPPVVSDDGRFYWDGANWVPFQQIGTIMPVARRRAAYGPASTTARLFLLMLVVLASSMAFLSGGALGVLLLGMAAVLGFIAVRPPSQT